MTVRPTTWLLALLAACSGGSEPEDTAIDAAIDSATTGAVTFRLSYQSDVPDSIFVQSSTEAGGQGWLTVRTAAGAPLDILDDCGVCDCGQCGACPVCGLAQPEVVEIAHGAHLDWTWDAVVHALGSCSAGGPSCEQPQALPAGSYIARFCWSWSSDGVGPGHHVGPLTCADQPFSWPLPAAAPVEHALCACG